jgi:hypothetical protein
LYISVIAALTSRSAFIAPSAIADRNLLFLINGPSPFSKYSTFHKPCIDFKCSRRRGAIGEVEIKPVTHIINENAPTQSTNINISAKMNSGTPCNTSGNGQRTLPI